MNGCARPWSSQCALRKNTCPKASAGISCHKRIWRATEGGTKASLCTCGEATSCVQDPSDTPLPLYSSAPLSTPILHCCESLSFLHSCTPSRNFVVHYSALPLLCFNSAKVLITVMCAQFPEPTVPSPSRTHLQHNNAGTCNTVTIVNILQSCHEGSDKVSCTAWTCHYIMAMKP